MKPKIDRARYYSLLPAACMVLIMPLAATAQTVAIYAGRLIDGQSSEVIEERTIVVEDDRIVEIAAGYITPPGVDTIVDLTGHTVMPGFIDTHVHLSSEQSPGRYEERFRLDPADFAFRSVRYSERTLMAGFTTIRDLGANDGLAISLRNAINQGWIDGPRIYAAGKSIATTGGHADPSNGTNTFYAPNPGPAEGVINGAEDAYEAVRARYREGADLIKITATGGVLSVAASGENPQFTIEEVEAIVTAAADYGFKVAAHAHGTEGMSRAVLAGVDSIEHGTYMTEELMQLMREHGTAYVPTLSAARFAADMAQVDGYFPEVVRRKAAEIGPFADETFAQAYAAGVHIVFGTDTGVSPHGENWREFVYMHEAGMPVMEAIRSATVDAAALLGAESELGAIEPGKLADIVAVPGDPIEDVGLFGEVDFVMKGGAIYRSPEGQ